MQDLGSLFLSGDYPSILSTLGQKGIFSGFFFDKLAKAAEDLQNNKICESRIMDSGTGGKDL